MRIQASNAYVYDFCRRCFPSKQKAITLFANKGDGPDGRGNCFDYEGSYDHPDYEDGDYCCHKCGKKLTSKDN